MTTKKRTPAAVIKNNRVEHYVMTALPGGTVVDYGYPTDDGRSLIKLGSGKISRAQRWMGRRHDMWEAGGLPYFDVNQGGGPAI